MMVFINRMGAAVLAGDIQIAFEATPAETGLLSSLFFYTYALMQIPGGLLTDHIGPRRVMLSSLLIGSAGIGIFAAAPTMSWALAGRFLIGVGMASILVPSYRILANWFPPQKFIAMASIVVSTAGLGGLLAGAPLAVGGIVLGWRTCQMILAVLTFLLALSVWLNVYNFPDKEKNGAQTGRKPFSMHIVMENLRLVCADKQCWVLAFWFFVNGGICFSFSGLWAGPYFSQVCGWSKEATGMLISLFGIGIVIGPLSASYLCRKLSGRGLLSSSMAVLAAILILLMILGEDLPFSVACLWCVAFTTVIAAPFGVVFDIVKRSHTAEVSGLASGFVYTFCMMGAACMQAVIGLWLQNEPKGQNFTHEDFFPIFAVYALLALTATVAPYLLKKEKHD